MRALVIVALAWVGFVVANAHNVEVSPGNGRDGGISFHGNWKNTTDDCGPAFVTNTIGDGLAYSFKGAAVYVYGTIACGWAGLVNISVDGVFNTTINRENCDAVPANGTRVICRYPWMSKDGLDPNVEHKLTVTLVGPSSGNVVAELRSIRYTVPIATSAAVPSSTDDDDDWTPDETTVTSAPTASSESADSPLPQLASLRLSTAATCGIIIGIILFFLFALAVCIVLRRRSNQRRRQANMAGMIGPRSMVSQGRRNSRHSRYPTEHLSWSPAAERLEEAKAQQAAGRRNSAGSFGSTGRSSWGRRRMDSIPESDWEQHNADHSGPAALAGVIAGSSRSPRDEKGGFSWTNGSSPPSSPGGRERKESERAAFYVSNSVPSPSPSTRLAFPSLAASGDYWSRRTSRSSGGRFTPLPASPLRTSMVAEGGELRPGS